MIDDSPTSNTAPTEQVASQAKLTITGKVVSTKMDKTIVIEVERRIPHATFKKIIRRSTKYYAHDEQGKASLGDTVIIQSSRPLSKLKRWVLIEVK
jgi:small subunit ribosomal protein S17